MHYSQLARISIAGVAASVPPKVSGLSEMEGIYDAEEIRKIGKNVGVLNRHIADDSCCSSDLCEDAARRLLNELGWNPTDVDVLLFVSQTPDYTLPATACTLQSRLGLGKNSVAFDINLGCSGFVYGLWQAGAMVASGAARKVLLLAGDTISKVVSKEDRSCAFLFGDAGTATALEFKEDAGPIHFCMGTDGSGYQNLIIPGGRFRTPTSSLTTTPETDKGGNVRTMEQLHMNGAEIFAFTLREVVPMVEETLAKASWTADDVDFCVMHQANKFIIKHLSAKLGLSSRQVPLSLGQYGNTSCASIPLTLCANVGVVDAPKNAVFAGFGVGYSWASAALKYAPKTVLPVHVLVHEG